MCYFQNLGFGPLSSFGIQTFKTYSSWLIQVFYLFFFLNKGEDIIFGLQSECRESELTPKLLSASFFSESHHSPSEQQKASEGK